MRASFAHLPFHTVFDTFRSPREAARPCTQLYAFAAELLSLPSCPLKWLRTRSVKEDRPGKRWLDPLKTPLSRPPSPLYYFPAPDEYGPTWYQQHPCRVIF